MEKGDDIPTNGCVGGKDHAEAAGALNGLDDTRGRKGAGGEYVSNRGRGGEEGDDGKAALYEPGEAEVLPRCLLSCLGVVYDWGDAFRQGEDIEEEADDFGAVLVIPGPDGPLEYDIEALKALIGHMRALERF